MIYTTLNRIKAHGPEKEQWEKLLKHLKKRKGNDDPLKFSVLVKCLGPKDAICAIRCEPQHERKWRLFAVWNARQVEYMIKDPVLSNAIGVAERFAYGRATAEELSNAFNLTGEIVRRPGTPVASKSASAWVAHNACHPEAHEAAIRTAWDVAASIAWSVVECSTARDQWTYANAIAKKAARNAAWELLGKEFLRTVK